MADSPAPALRVPPTHRPAFSALLGLSDEVASSVLDAIEAVPAFAGVGAIVTRVAESGAGAEMDISDLVESGTALAFQTHAHGWNAADTAERLSRSQDLAVPEDRRAQAATRLRRLIGAPSVTSAARSAELSMENTRVFQAVRILTDIRPVFSDDPSVAPEGAVVIEQMKLQFFENGESREIFIALDTADIEQVRDAAERALAKAETLKAVLKAAGMNTGD